MDYGDGERARARTNSGAEIMIRTLRTTLGLVATAGLAVTLGACSSYHDRVSPGVWSGETVAPPVSHTAPAAPVSVAPPHSSRDDAPPPRLATVQRGSVTAGCDGTFTRLSATGGVTAQGRAYNTGAGLVALDAHGNRSTPIASATNGESLYFRPDCDCQTVRQMSEAGQPAPVCNAR
jgi:hypothetical protein